MGWDTALTHRCVLGRLVYCWLCGYSTTFASVQYSFSLGFDQRTSISTRNCMWFCLYYKTSPQSLISVSEITTLSRLKITLFIGLSLGISSDCIGNSFTRLPAVFSSLFYMQQIVLFIFTFMHLADAFIQSNFQCIQVIHFLSVFPGNWTHNLCAANAMLYHWTTGTLCVFMLGAWLSFFWISLIQ